MSEVQPAGMPLRVLGCAAQHPGDRTEQQDRVALLTSSAAPDCALAVLADGVGGRSGGALAAQCAIDVSHRRFDRYRPGRDDPRAFFTGLIADVNASLRLGAGATGLQPHTTFAGVLVQRGRVDWCHVGDSRVYHFRHGALAHLTVDQTVELAADPSAAMQARRLTTVLGVRDAPLPRLGGIDDPGESDRFLLCSDGLWSHLAVHEIGQSVAGDDPRRASAAMIATARARARGRGDNCSLLLLQLSAWPAGAQADPAHVRSHAPEPAVPGFAAARRAA